MSELKNAVIKQEKVGNLRANGRAERVRLYVDGSSKTFVQYSVRNPELKAFNVLLPVTAKRINTQFNQELELVNPTLLSIGQVSQNNHQVGDRQVVDYNGYVDRYIVADEIKVKGAK
ncbi:MULTISPECIES: hypothetical protein [unclassified Enterococcus]|uniref:hypothetical protein n=1 Tax=unclassified Enterococcus TaxID=2608891 RepID=UPI001553721A|nr:MULTISPECIES: hypothetical protein [unclassified Enterococcus]MBS7576959.1 hypothetical protein [Enterococcus sp. MMGLQ5-2]MBS7584366.1 hypothetical protein [Enterococcus sp. MMGLQ5-1]NPD12221.1 hypothetical protein [Enterococcus sp. MMGLQ5-1]NPD36793.1 hypothetical protein [Enterococcus sp. MMGLQ5-2]